MVSTLFQVYEEQIDKQDMVNMFTVRIISMGWSNRKYKAMEISRGEYFYCWSCSI